MQRSFTTVLIASFLLTGCTSGQNSRLYPPNWFGPSQSAATVQAEANPLIPSRTGIFGNSRRESVEPDLTTPIASITALQVERVPGGSIIRATGVDHSQGAFNAVLVHQNEEELPVDGVLAYSFELQRPEGPRPVGPAHTREVVVARKLTDLQLRGVRSIRVQAAQNALVVRR